VLFLNDPSPKRLADVPGAVTRYELFLESAANSLKLSANRKAIPIASQKATLIQLLGAAVETFDYFKRRKM
jgi:hypothetical protein